jgi:hypothetical protein
VDALSPNIVYAGTQNEGLFKSTDYGDTWAKVGTGLSGAITFLTIDPTKIGRLFASTGMAFFLSEDGGQIWTNVLSMPAWTVTIDPVSPLRTYATTRTQGVFRSSDGGHTWQSINSGLTNLSMGRSAPVIVDPTNHETLYVGSEGGGVFKSLDGGDYWFPVNLGLSDLSVSGLAKDPVNSTLYASGPSGVFKFCQAPVITGVFASPDVLWPPNHKFADVTINYTETSNCPSTFTLSVTSNEPGPDEWIIVDAHHVQLRAERNGNGSGRVYIITITSTNEGGTTTQAVTVLVPHDQGH